MFELTVAAGTARGLLDLAVSKGASRAELLRRSGIDPADLAEQDKRIPFARYLTLMRAGKVLAHDPALALHFGAATNLADISILGLIGAASETAADAFAQLNRYSRLVLEVDLGESDRFVLTPGNGGIWLADMRLNPNASPEVTESAFARIASGIAQIASTASPVKRVHVTHSDPGYRAEYERIFGAPVVFDSDKNALLFDKAVLKQRIARGPPRYVFGILSERAEALLASLERSKSTRARVESLLMPVLHTGNASMDAIASQLGVSRWTLLRNLKGEDTTFAKVLDELRHKLALHYLGGKKVSVNEAAYLVGFSEPAAFSRAFKRWTGANPSTLRGAKG